MNMFRIVLHLFHFLSWFVQESHSNGGFCEPRNPVVKICTDHVFVNTQSVFIDTVSVPTFQHTSCECIISPFGYEVRFSFVVYGQRFPRGMQFKINDIVINETSRTRSTHLISETSIYFSTAEDHRKGEGTCVNVYTDDRTYFNITCMRSTRSNTRQDKGTRQVSLVIPLVTAIAGTVCLAIVIAVIIFYKRRKTWNRRMVNCSNSTAEQEQENNYYMTENPMYNVTETEPNAEHTENVYHYIEHNQLDSRRPTVQYESLPDSPVGKHLPTNLSEHNQNYDYTTCQESGYVAGNTNTLDTANERGKMPSDKADVGETMYDRTDKAAVKQFSGMNEYHHLRPAGSSEKFVLDTYDTIGKVGEKEDEQKDPEYDVTHSM